MTFMDQLQMHFVNVVQTRTLEILMKTTAVTHQSKAPHNDTTLLSYVDLCKVDFLVVSLLLNHRVSLADDSGRSIFYVFA